MTWITLGGRRATIMTIAGATLFLLPLAATAADLERDYPRHATRDYWADREYEPRYVDRCVPRHVVRDRLRDAGWRNFDNAEARGAHAVVDARRPSGRLFRLRIDRCSGDVILARPLGPPRWRHHVRDDWRDHDRGQRWRRWADGERRWLKGRDRY